MKKTFMGLVASTLLVLSVGTANAIPMTWTDTHEAGNRYMNTRGETERWTFKLDGFNAGVDWVTSYTIKLFLRDDRNDSWWRPYEYAFFNQPGFIGDRSFEVDTGTTTVGFSLLGLISLNTDGTLSASLKRTGGDFYFRGAELVANGKRHVSVPEPSVLGLLGLGLIGLVFARRKHQMQ